MFNKTLIFLSGLIVCTKLDNVLSFGIFVHDLLNDFINFSSYWDNACLLSSLILLIPAIYNPSSKSISIFLNWKGENQMLTTENHALITFYAALNWAKCYSNDCRAITGLAKSYFKENVVWLNKIVLTA